jgi:chromosome segregation ATPase
MFEDDVSIDVAHDQVAARDQIDGSMPMHVVEKSASSSPAPAALNGHTQDQLQEINQLINDLEAATEANNANVVILRGKLAVSQQQLETKAAELEGLLKETAHHQQQLQATRSELADVSASKASLDADYRASQQQLETKAAELEGLLKETAHHQQQLQATRSELADVSASKASLDADYRASQQQLETKAAELEDLKEEAELILQQLHQVQEELEVVFLEGQDKATKLLSDLNATQQKLDSIYVRSNDFESRTASYRALLLGQRKDWIADQSFAGHSVAKRIGKKILLLTFASS